LRLGGAAAAAAAPGSAGLGCTSYDPDGENGENGDGEGGEDPDTGLEWLRLYFDEVEL